MAAAAGVGAGAEEDGAAVVGVARRGGSARRSAASGGRRPSWAAAGPRAASSRTWRSGWLFRTRGRLGLEVVGQLARPWPARAIRGAAVLEPGERPQRLAAEAERVVAAGDQSASSWSRRRRPAARARTAASATGFELGLALGRGDQARRGTRDLRRGLSRPSGLDRGDPDLRRRPSRRGRSSSSGARVAGVAGRGGQRDPLRAAARGRSSAASISRDRPAGRSWAVAPVAAELAGRAWPAAAACGPGRRPRRPCSATTTAVSGSLICVEDVVGRLLQLGARELGQDPAEQRQRPRAGGAARPGRASCSAAEAGRSGVPGGDERLVAVDREVRRQARPAPSWPALSRSRSP